MWHDHDIDFARWLHPAMWCMALKSWHKFTKWQHPAMWHVALGWHAVEFARWQHPAIWHVALGSWHWIRQVAVPCNVAGGSGMTCHGIRPNICHIGILHLVWFWPYHRSGHDILHQSAKFYPNRTTLNRKNDVMSIFKMADLSHLGFYRQIIKQSINLYLLKFAIKWH